MLIRFYYYEAMMHFDFYLNCFDRFYWMVTRVRDWLYDWIFSLFIFWRWFFADIFFLWAVHWCFCWKEELFYRLLTFPLFHDWKQFWWIFPDPYDAYDFFFENQQLFHTYLSMIFLQSISSHTVFWVNFIRLLGWCSWV